MTPQEFYQRIAGKVIEPHSVLKLSPGPVALQIGPQDALAAKLILWLVEQMPEDATQGFLEDVLDSAKFWAVFWSSLERDGDAQAAPSGAGEAGER